MYLPLPMTLTFFGLLLPYGPEGGLLPKASLAERASETHQSTSDSSHASLHTLLSSISPKSLQSQLPPKGISCEDLMPEALEEFASVPRLSQILIQASLALALQGAGCSWHAETLILRLYKELGEAESNALLFLLAGALGTAHSPAPSNSSTAALEFNLEQLAHTRALRCKGLTPIHGSFLHGQAHRVFKTFPAAAAACHQLGETCAGVAPNGTSSFQVLDRNGSYFLPRHGAHSWLHQCQRLARGRRSTPEDCLSEREHNVHSIVEWVPGVSTFYNFGTSIYYATQDCTDLAKERALEGVMDLGFDMLGAMTGGASSILGLGVSVGAKAGVRSLINYYRQQKEP
ncbi:apolipoprotein F [Hemicordylus capensis]|uniref:apolipoprotein F n=1 Tax=Hemicordylus capensis TaxID=884348 RepID=UPI0023033FDB|nr:apolipoprotein F [Hemicordylus capensis]